MPHRHRDEIQSGLFRPAADSPGINSGSVKVLRGSESQIQIIDTPDKADNGLIADIFLQLSPDLR